MNTSLTPIHRSHGSALAKGLSIAAMMVLPAWAGATVVTTLPTGSSAAWNEVIFSGTSMVNNGSSVTLTTANTRGVWFGHHSAAADPDPAWSLGNSAQGNWLSLDVAFSSGARDWVAYVSDGSHVAQIEFLDTDCNASAACYSAPRFQGVTLTYRTPGVAQPQYMNFAIADMTQIHTYELLLKNGLVSYRIDGQAVFSGNAWASSSANMLVGDSSGSTPTGTGSMTISALRLDTAPVENVLASTVPEPEGWALALAGMGVCAWHRCRREALQGAVT